MTADPFEVLRTPAPAFSKKQASELLLEYYDIDAELEPLVSERDQNFLVSVAGGTKYVLKFANSAETPEVTDFQIQALLPDLIVARRLTTTMISQWRASLYPENIDYILGDEARSRRKLELTASLCTEDTRQRFREVCCS